MHVQCWAFLPYIPLWSQINVIWFCTLCNAYLACTLLLSTLYQVIVFFTLCHTYLILQCCYVTGNSSWLCNKAIFNLQSGCPSSTYKTICRLLGMTLNIIKDKYACTMCIMSILLHTPLFSSLSP